MRNPARPAFVWSPDYELAIGKHVFPTEKFRLLKELLVARGTIREGEVEFAPMASDRELLTALLPEYLADLRGYRHTPRTNRSELPITREIIEGMVRTAGGTILCVRRALERGAACHLGGGFHHGFADHAEGFCYINDIAVAIAVARREGIVNRVAVIDVDTHQGNGTASIFRQTPEVYTFSIHDETIYPQVKETSDFDIGLPRNPGQDVYMAELERGLQAALDHKPELVVYAGGVDPFEEDVLGKLALTAETLRLRDELILGACAQRGIPFVTVVSGGYARQVSDTVRLHGQTVETAIRCLAAGPGPRP